jgi:hypothetical protein
MNSYKTASQATGVARTLSRSAGCTILVYQAADSRFITARPSDAVSGLVIGIYQNGYKLQSGGQRA